MVCASGAIKTECKYAIFFAVPYAYYLGYRIRHAQYEEGQLKTPLNLYAMAYCGQT